MAATSKYVEINPQLVATAAAGIDDAGARLSAGLLDLIRELNRLGAPWGDDDLGRAFFNGATDSMGFRQARDELLDGTAQLALALRGHAVRAVRMARTWAEAESGDHPRFRLDTAGATTPALRRVAGEEAGHLVRDDPPPPWYQEIEPLLEELVAGCRRPAGSAAGMESVARAFDRMAGTIDDVAGTAGEHARRIPADNAGRDIEAFGESFARLTRNGGGHLTDAAAACRGLAGYCRYMAIEIKAAETGFAAALAYLAVLWTISRLLAGTPQGPVYTITALAETRRAGLRLLTVLRAAELRAAAAGASYVGGLDLVRQVTRLGYGLQDGFDAGALGEAVGLGVAAGGATGLIYRLLGRAAANGGTLSGLLTGTLPGRLITHTGVGGAVNTAVDVAGNAIDNDGRVRWDEVHWGRDLLMGAGMGLHAEAMRALRPGDQVIAADLGVHDRDLPAGSGTSLADAGPAARPEDPMPSVVDGLVLDTRVHPAAGKEGEPAGRPDPAADPLAPVRDPGRPEPAPRPAPAPRRETEPRPGSVPRSEAVSRPEPASGPGVASRPEVASRPGPASGPGVASRPEPASGPGVASRPEAVSRPEPASGPGVASRPEAVSRPGAASGPAVEPRPDVVSRPAPAPGPGAEPRTETAASPLDLAPRREAGATHEGSAASGRTADGPSGPLGWKEPQATAVHDTAGPAPGGVEERPARGRREDPLALAEAGPAAPPRADRPGSRIDLLLNGPRHAPSDGGQPLTIRPDCVDWAGYKPCRVQRELRLPDCGGCSHHRPAPAVVDLSHQRPYDPAELRQARRVGVVEMGGLGSHVRTSAVVKALRGLNPHVEVHWFTHRRGAEVAGYIPGVRPVDVETGGVPHDLVRSLDVVLNFDTGDVAAEIARNARCVGGLALGAQGRFQPASEHAYGLQRLQIDDAWRRNNTATMQKVLLEAVGLDDAAPAYEVVLGEEAAGAARERLTGLFGAHDREVIALNIGSSVKGRLKRWTAESWARLAGDLAADGAAVVVLSGPEDHDIRDQVAPLLAESPWIGLVDDMHVGEFMAILGAADVVVTADSLALHAAAAQGRPVVALAGPMPHRELEIAETDRMVGPKLGCSPCYLRCHRRIQGECMTLIGVDEVFAHVRELRDRR